MTGGVSIMMRCSTGCCRRPFAANTDLRVAEANLSAARAVLEAAESGRYRRRRPRPQGTYGRDPVTEEILELGGHRPENLWVFGRALGRLLRDRLVSATCAAPSKPSRADTAANCRRARRRQSDARGRDRAGLCANLRARRGARRRPSFSTWSAAKPTLPCAVTKPGGTRSSDVVRAEGLVAQVRAGIPPLGGPAARCAVSTRRSCWGGPPLTRRPMPKLRDAAPPRRADPHR